MLQKIKLFDSHCHLDDAKLAKDLPAVLERVRLSPGLMEIDWRRKERSGQDSALKKGEN